MIQVSAAVRYFEPMRVLHNKKEPSLSKRLYYCRGLGVSVRAVALCQAGTGGPGVTSALRGGTLGVQWKGSSELERCVNNSSPLRRAGQ